ncbi:type III glutamate--ammonia ligase [Piscinibacter defluvii]|uniref:type III glutamate--ammonia ligase n=1 Tax=Piscinibacter defluvii TaxID=1796922 RepID=UPI000FDE11D5|nr:type III glutamate--ammonia ligase [Piscinibacter defluvii]
MSEEIRQRLAAQGVHTLIAQFTDLNGVAKGKFVPLAEWPTLLATGAGFSGPSIAGTGLPRMGPRSEYYGRGDAATAVALPWMPGYARVVCDGFVDAAPFEACPRQVLRRQLARLAERGWSLQTGIEPEFFLLRRTPEGRLVPADEHDRLDKPSYDLKSLPRRATLLHELASGLQACGLDVFQVDHEDAHGQYELNFRHADALASADALMLFKLGAQAIAERHGLVFSMMPKPFANQPGSGMHFHVSLWQGTRCLFDDAATLRHFVAGVLLHSAGLAALAAPTVNSYKRLVVGESLSGTSWAPASVSHGPNNRTALVRTLPGRFEWRLPDAAANPYLATAGLIAAGLDGLERQLDPGPAAEDDLFEAPPARLRERGIVPLPQNLAEAATALENDAVLTAALGPLLTREFLAARRAEWDEYARHVSDWELRRYGERF